MSFDLRIFLAKAEERRHKRIGQDEKPWVRRNPSASDLMGCDRYAVLTVAAWMHKPPPDARGKAAMEHGRHMETVVLRELEEEGYELRERQSRVELKMNGKLICSGNLDCVIWEDGEKIPTDVKAPSFWNFNRVDTADDLDRSIWTLKWKRQMVSYMLSFNAEHSFLRLANDWDRKWVYVPMDWEMAETITAQCELVMHVWEDVQERAEKYEPKVHDDILNDIGIRYADDTRECDRCPFGNKLCFPKYLIDMEKSDTQPELEPVIEQMLMVKQSHREYELLNKQIKEAVAGHRKVYAGKYIIDITPTPKNVKAVEAHTRTEYRRNIREVTS